MPDWNYSTKKSGEPRYKCAVCGKAMSRPGTHMACRNPNDTKDMGTLSSVRVAIAKAEVQMRKEMWARTKRWKKGMGKKKLKEMFPDIYDREYGL